MQLKRSTDILLRILIYLAARRDPGPVSVHQLSEALNWNKNLIVKVTHFAVQQGLLTAVRGRSGGVVLAKSPEAYRIGDIVRLMEGDEALVCCDEPHCPLLTGGCRLKGALWLANESFYRELNSLTLAQVVDPPDGAAIQIVPATSESSADGGSASLGQ